MFPTEVGHRTAFLEEILVRRTLPQTPVLLVANIKLAVLHALREERMGMMTSVSSGFQSKIFKEIIEDGVPVVERVRICCLRAERGGFPLLVSGEITLPA